MLKLRELINRKLLFSIMILTLAGCSAKTGEETSSPKFVVTPEVSNLSPQEISALKSSGKIDRNIPDAEMADITKQYKYFLRKGRADVCAVTEKSSHYLNYARQIFRERGMPEDLAYLAIVESGYRPTALSPSGAAGVWQFMPATGLRYGLSQDQWQDERLDPFKATEAAADYLQYLHNYFGDWPTAIAAYNAGEGKLSRAKEGAGASNFFEVKAKNELLDEKTKLKDETKNYVPKFMAVTKIMRNLDDLGFSSASADKEQKIHRLSVAPGTNLSALSQACALPWKDFSVYNPHHKRTITCTDKRTFVYVPEKAQEMAATYLQSHQTGEFADWKLIKLKKSSDTLSKLGKRYNIPLAALQTANPGVNKLKNGQILLLPSNITLKQPSQIAEKGTATGNQVKSNGREHKITANETLYAIARKYNVSPELLQKHNNISNPSSVRTGQVIKIPATGSQAKNSPKKNYVVQPKDSLWSISRKLNISVADLKKWNNIDEKQLRTGAVLIVSN